MWLSSWLEKRSSRRPPHGRAQDRSALRLFRPLLEALEDRAVPSGNPTILTITSLADSGKDSLRGAILKADSNTNKTYEIDIKVTGTIVLESSLPDLANTISIVGQGTTKTLIQRDTLAAPFRIVTVEAGRSVALSGLAIAQGNAGSGKGGAIDNFGNLTLANCDLDSNSAANGGAVENEAGANLTATGTIFTGNQAGTYTGATAGYGGGIDNNGSLTVSGGAFTGGTATDGGGINNDGALTVTGACNFDSNSATSQSLTDFGGGIANNGTAQVSGITFDNNEADNHGGGIYNAAGQSLVVTNCQFTLNHVPFGNGGGIENGGTLTDNGAAYTNNSAQVGGAIENAAGGSLTVNAGASYSGNTATVGGGAINNNSTLAVSGAAFTGNTAPYGGGIATDGTATVSGCTLTTNHATRTSFSNGGGAIWNIGLLTVLGNSSFVGNTAGHDGGAIDNFGTTTVSQTAFTSAGTTPGNSATNGGGAISNRAGATLTLNAGTSFSGNSAGNIGGAIENVGTATVTQAAFTSNSSVIGAAIFSEFGATLTVNAGTDFTSNPATDSGGAIYSRGTLTAEGARFTSNTAPNFGGAIASYGGASVSGCNFSFNKATGSLGQGGAVANQGTLVVGSTSEFTGNSAAYKGGAILNVSSGNATVAETVFSDNSAEDGGAIVNSSTASLTLNPGCTFHHNFTSNTVFGGSGGAIFNEGTLTASGAVFDFNTAGDGGAIFSSGAATVTGSNFTSNSGADHGGAISTEFGAMTVSGCTLANNRALYGAGIENFGGVLTVSFGCDIDSNTATVSGGGIWTNGSGTTFVLGSFVRFNSPDDTHTEAGSTLNVSDSIIGVRT